MSIQQIEPLAVSPTQAALLTSLSKRKIQDLMTRGVIPFRKAGRRTLIPFGALKDFLRAELNTKMEARTGA
jgi:excisionase family DNA binding protein